MGPAPTGTRETSRMWTAATPWPGNITALQARRCHQDPWRAGTQARLVSSFLQTARGNVLPRARSCVYGSGMHSCVYASGMHSGWWSWGACRTLPPCLPASLPPCLPPSFPPSLSRACALSLRVTFSRDYRDYHASHLPNTRINSLSLWLSLHQSSKISPGRGGVKGSVCMQQSRLNPKP